MVRVFILLYLLTVCYAGTLPFLASCKLEPKGCTLKTSGSFTMTRQWPDVMMTVFRWKVNNRLKIDGYQEHLREIRIVGPVKCENFDVGSIIIKDRYNQPICPPSRTQASATSESTSFSLSDVSSSIVSSTTSLSSTSLQTTSYTPLLSIVSSSQVASSSPTASMMLTTPPLSLSSSPTVVTTSSKIRLFWPWILSAVILVFGVVVLICIYRRRKTQRETVRDLEMGAVHFQAASLNAPNIQLEAETQFGADQVHAVTAQVDQIENELGAGSAQNRSEGDEEESQLGRELWRICSIPALFDFATYNPIYGVQGKPKSN